MIIRDKKPIETTVTLQMSRSNLNLFHLKIEDNKSHTLIAEISLDAEQFADFLSTRQANECQATIFSNTNVGKKHEIMSVALKLTGMSKECLIEAINVWNAANLDEEWKIGIPGEFNHYHYDSEKHIYSVSAHRYVKDN